MICHWALLEGMSFNESGLLDPFNCTRVDVNAAGKSKPPLPSDVLIWSGWDYSPPVMTEVLAESAKVRVGIKAMDVKVHKLTNLPELPTAICPEFPTDWQTDFTEFLSFSSVSLRAVCESTLPQHEFATEHAENMKYLNMCRLTSYGPGSEWFGVSDGLMGQVETCVHGTVNVIACIKIVELVQAAPGERRLHCRE